MTRRRKGAGERGVFGGRLFRGLIGRLSPRPSAAAVIPAKGGNPEMRDQDSRLKPGLNPKLPRFSLIKGLQGHVCGWQIAPSGAVTLTLALSHQGRGDTLVGIRAWLRVACLVGLWIPAFAGMTGAGTRKEEAGRSRTPTAKRKPPRTPYANAAQTSSRQRGLLGHVALFVVSGDARLCQNQDLEDWGICRIPFRQTRDCLSKTLVGGILRIL